MWVSFKLAGTTVKGPVYITGETFQPLTALLRDTSISIEIIDHIFLNVQSTKSEWFETNYIFKINEKNFRSDSTYMPLTKHISIHNVFTREHWVNVVIIQNL